MNPLAIIWIIQFRLECLDRSASDAQRKWLSRDVQFSSLSENQTNPVIHSIDKNRRSIQVEDISMSTRQSAFWCWPQKNGSQFELKFITFASWRMTRKMKFRPLIPTLSRHTRPMLNNGLQERMPKRLIFQLFCAYSDAWTSCGAACEWKRKKFKTDSSLWPITHWFPEQHRYPIANWVLFLFQFPPKENKTQIHQRNFGTEKTTDVLSFSSASTTTPIQHDWPQSELASKQQTTFRLQSTSIRCRLWIMNEPS